MKKCIFAGSFDPITLGHIDIVNRALTIFDKVIIAVGKNVGKHSLLDDKEKEMLINEVFKNNEKVDVLLYEGFTGDLCNQLDVNTIIRGLRNAKDFDYEYSLDVVNKKLFPNVETLYFATNQNYLHISSSYVREILSFGGNVEEFVPKCVQEYLVNRK